MIAILIIKGVKGSVSMQQNTKVFDGLFDKFNKDDRDYTDIFLPVKRELGYFFISRQKTKNLTTPPIASNYGMPLSVWEQDTRDMNKLSKMIQDRLHQTDARLRKLNCKVSYKGTSIVLDCQANLKPPRERKPIVFKTISD